MSEADDLQGLTRFKNAQITSSNGALEPLLEAIGLSKLFAASARTARTDDATAALATRVRGSEMDS